MRTTSAWRTGQTSRMHSLAATYDVLFAVLLRLLLLHLRVLCVFKTHAVGICKTLSV